MSYGQSSSRSLTHVFVPQEIRLGVHFDAEGKIGIYAVESKEYQQYSKNKGVKQLIAMWSQRV
jgi:uncharacterized protein DUF6157